MRRVRSSREGEEGNQEQATRMRDQCREEGRGKREETIPAILVVGKGPLLNPK